MVRSAGQPGRAGPRGAGARRDDAAGLARRRAAATAARAAAATGGEPRAHAAAPVAAVRALAAAAGNRPVQRLLAGRRAGPAPRAGRLVQRKLGFEIEMLALVDVGGRPLPEKVHLGTYGSERVELTVDHSSQVAGPAPLRAAAATTRTVPGRGGAMLTLGAYDLPPDARSRVPEGAAADPRPARRAGWRRLGPEDWEIAAAIAGPDVPAGVMEAMDRGVRDFRRWIDDWEIAEALDALGVALAHGVHWLSTAQPPADPQRAARFRTSRRVLDEVCAELNAELVFWAPRHATGPPGGAARQYRTGTVPGGLGPWSETHPVEEHLGGDVYHSILELVTRPYEVENGAQTEALAAAVGQAVELAGRIEAVTDGFSRRVLLAGTRADLVLPGDTWIGNEAVPGQTTGGSIQATYAVDLAQLASMWRSVITPGGITANPLFMLKHQSDEPGGGPGRINYRTRTEAARAVTVAGDVIRAFGPAGEDWARYDDFATLRGLLTLVCQYLLMGRHFAVDGRGALDKNVVPLLSRTDLASVYRDQVTGSPSGPTGEKEWVMRRWPRLRDEILRLTARRSDSMLFTDQGEAWQGARRPPFDVTCQAFVDNVFTGERDGVTAHLDEGQFKAMAAESVRPQGSALEHQPRSGPVFELRNMVPAGDWSGEDRFHPDSWVGLAMFFSKMLQALHARSGAATDVRYNPYAGAREEPRAWWA